MPSRINYSWGTERPSSRLDRIKKKQIPAILRQIDAAKKRLDQLVADLASLEQEATNIEYLTESGCYDRSREADLIERGHLSAAQDTNCKTINRGGRPRKYPDAEQVGRPTRAKTPAGIERARLGLNLRSCRKRSDIAISAVDSNAAESEPIEQRPIPDCKTSDHAFDELVEQRAAPSEPTLIDILPADDMSSIARLEEESLPSESQHYNADFDYYSDCNLIDFIKSDDEPKYKVPVERGNLDELEWIRIYDCYKLHVDRFIDVEYFIRGDKGAFKHDYDFVNPYNEHCGLKDLKDLFPSFGLPVNEFFTTEERGLKKFEQRAVRRSYKFGGARPFDEFTAKQCIDLFYNSRPDPQPELAQRKIRELLAEHGKGSYVKLLYQFHSMFIGALSQEVDRIIVWPIVEKRLKLVEYTHVQVLKRPTDLDRARVSFALEEYTWLTRLTTRQQTLYFRAVRAIDWVGGFSLQEMIDWSENDDYRLEFIELDGFPRWLFPKRLLHAALLGSNIFYTSEVEGHGIVSPPSIEELNEFLEQGDAFIPWFARGLDVETPERLEI